MNESLQVFLVLRVDVGSPIDELFHDLGERFEFSRQVERRVEALGDDRVGVRAVVQQENGGKFVIWNEKMDHVRSHFCQPRRKSSGSKKDRGREKS